jgi:hypothetical protein
MTSRECGLIEEMMELTVNYKDTSLKNLVFPSYTGGDRADLRHRERHSKQWREELGRKVYFGSSSGSRKDQITIIENHATINSFDLFRKQASGFVRPVARDRAERKTVLECS